MKTILMNFRNPMKQ